MLKWTCGSVLKHIRRFVLDQRAIENKPSDQKTTFAHY